MRTPHEPRTNPARTPHTPHGNPAREPRTPPYGGERGACGVRGGDAGFIAAQSVLAELRTPLHEPRTAEQLMAATGLSRPAVRTALAWLCTTHGVMRANFRDKTKVAWMLPS